MGKVLSSPVSRHMNKAYKQGALLIDPRDTHLVVAELEYMEGVKCLSNVSITGKNVVDVRDRITAMYEKAEIPFRILVITKAIRQWPKDQ